MKTMQEVLAEHQQKVGIHDMRSHCWCGWGGEKTGRTFAAHQSAALSAAGYGLVADAKREALEEAADALERHPRLRKSQLAWAMYPDHMATKEKSFKECGSILRDRAAEMRQGRDAES